MDTDDADKRRAIEGINWFHRIDLGGGIVTPGIDNTPFKISKLNLPASLAGKTVVDIGAWDGAMSFECERRQAARVLATDWYCWQSGNKMGFETARRLLGSRVEDLDLRVEDISGERIGKFDVVIFSGVLYHAPDPLGYLRRVRDVCRNLAVIETLVDAMDFPRPAMVFYEGKTLSNDPSNFFGPNRLCCEAMLREVGFRSVDMVNEFYGNRMVFHAHI
jgi:tRNA (mo5U34)-methyltransferase